MGTRGCGEYPCPQTLLVFHYARSEQKMVTGEPRASSRFVFLYFHDGTSRKECLHLPLVVIFLDIMFICGAYEIIHVPIYLFPLSIGFR